MSVASCCFALTPCPLGLGQHQSYDNTMGTYLWPQRERFGQSLESILIEQSPTKMKWSVFLGALVVLLFCGSVASQDDTNLDDLLNELFSTPNPNGNQPAPVTSRPIPIQPASNVNPTSRPVQPVQPVNPTPVQPPVNPNQNNLNAQVGNK